VQRLGGEKVTVPSTRFRPALTAAVTRPAPKVSQVSRGLRFRGSAWTISSIDVL